MAEAHIGFVRIIKQSESVQSADSFRGKQLAIKKEILILDTVSLRVN